MSFCADPQCGHGDGDHAKRFDPEQKQMVRGFCGRRNCPCREFKTTVPLARLDPRLERFRGR